MSRHTISDRPQTGTCSLCSQPIVRKGKLGWYHRDPNMGAVHGMRGHFATPVVGAVA